jgi:hypothetical protein
MVTQQDHTGEIKIDTLLFTKLVFIDLALPSNFSLNTMGISTSRL